MHPELFFFLNILQFKFFYKDHDDLNTPISAARGGMKRELSAIEKIVFVVFIQRICTAFVGIKFKVFPFAWLSHGKGQPHESRCLAEAPQNSRSPASTPAPNCSSFGEPLDSGLVKKIHEESN